jgi:drug/metabolite transporter, DME family
MFTNFAHGNRRGVFSIMLASTLWGTAGVASQAISHLTPTNSLSLSFLRLLIAAPVLMLAGRKALGKGMWSASRRDFALMALMGGLLAADQALYFTAITYAGVAIATLITICAAPVLVTLITSLIERQRPDSTTLLSVALAVTGTILLVLGSQSADFGSVSLIGIGLSLGAAVVYAGVIMIGQYLSGRCHPLQTTAIGFTSGALLLACAASLSGFVGLYPVQGWALIVYLGLIPTALAYGLFLCGMRTTPAPITSVLVLLEPLTATGLAWILYDERLGIVGVAGAAMLLTAIYMLSVNQG